MREVMIPGADPKPDEEIIFLRASVANQCNLSCVYCPKASGMENHVPARLRGRRLTSSEYCANLDHIAGAGVIRGISFTGGEPTLNPDLSGLVAHARRRFDRVELTTNGRFLDRHIGQLAGNLDVVKVSLDAVDRDLSLQIMRGQRADHDRATNAIRLCLEAGLTVGVNVVAMKRNLDQLDQLVALIRDLRRRATSGSLYVSVLDLYYTDETRQLWLSDFVPVDRIAAQLRTRLGAGQVQDRGGCEITWFEDAGLQIRLKSSYGSTYRSTRCDGCPVYCQEGMYGLKHSVEGWVTPCPTGDEGFGVHFAPGLEAEQAQRLLRPWLDELRSTRRVADSFQVFLQRRGLSAAGPR
jgi:molybdenum cofactor biosynthesis enzyme MoaA